MSRVVHFEIHAQNPERAIDFYSRLLGWEFRQWEGPMPYWLIRTGPTETPGIDGGLVQRPGPAPTPGQAVSSYVCTVGIKNLDALLERIPGLGGAIALAKLPIPGVGWLAYAIDTEGNTFGLMQADSTAA